MKHEMELEMKPGTLDKQEVQIDEREQEGAEALKQQVEKSAPSQEEQLKKKMEEIVNIETIKLSMKERFNNFMHGTKAFAEATPAQRKEQIAKGIARMEGDPKAQAELEALMKVDMKEARKFGKDLVDAGKAGHPEFKQTYEELLSTDPMKALKFAYAVGKYKYPKWDEKTNDFVDNTKYEGKDSGGTSA